jgi:hypothetical protein
MNRVTIELLLELLEGDREVIELLRECELLAADDLLVEDDLERALVARTLLRELEVNPPGVEIIVRMRAELVATRKQVAELLQQLRGPRRV